MLSLAVGNLSFVARQAYNTLWETLICERDAPLLLLHVLSRLHLWFVRPGQAGSSDEGQPGLPGAACRDGGSVGQLLMSPLLPGRQTETAGTG